MRPFELRRLYEYNQENRLVRISPASPTEGDNRLTFSYDYLGRRVRKLIEVYDGGNWTATSDRRFVYHSWRPIVEYEALSEDPDVPQRTYTWGVDLSRAGGAAALDGAAGIGGLVAICDPNDPNDPNDTFGAWAVLSDGNGNVVQLIDCTAATVNDAIDAHYQYDPYGNRLNAPAVGEVDNWLRFSTKYFDAETGLGYWGYRYYDPQTGRWLTRDPIGERGGVNLYGYARNGPTGSVDSRGLEWCSSVGKWEAWRDGNVLSEAGRSITEMHPGMWFSLFLLGGFGEAFLDLNMGEPSYDLSNNTAVDIFEDSLQFRAPAGLLAHIEKEVLHAFPGNAARILRKKYSSSR